MYNNPDDDYEEPIKRLDDMNLRMMTLEQTCTQILDKADQMQKYIE